VCVQKLTFVGLLVGATALAAPPPGHPTTAQAAQALGLSATTVLTGEGVVRATLDSNAYTYIQVVSANGERQWLAAPKLALAVGARIGFGDGAVMSNFYSKKLLRTFDQIRFVGAVQVLPQ